MTSTRVQLCEDDLSDLLWLVLKYGHKLAEENDYISLAHVSQLEKTLESLLNEIA